MVAKFRLASAAAASRADHIHTAGTRRRVGTTGAAWSALAWHVGQTDPVANSPNPLRMLRNACCSSLGYPVSSGAFLRSLAYQVAIERL